MANVIEGLSRAQAAQVLGVSPVRIDQLIQEGKLPYKQTALGRLIDPRGVESLKKERKVTALKGVSDVSKAA